MAKTDDRWNESPFGEVVDRDGRPVARQGFETYTDEQRKRQRAVEAAFQLQARTGDDSALIRLGILPDPDAGATDDDAAEA